MGGASGPHLSLTARKHISKKVPPQTLCARLSHSGAAWNLLFGARSGMLSIPGIQLCALYTLECYRRNACSSARSFNRHRCSPVLLLRKPSIPQAVKAVLHLQQVDRLAVLCDGLLLLLDADSMDGQPIARVSRSVHSPNSPMLGRSAVQLRNLGAAYALGHRCKLLLPSVSGCREATWLMTHDAGTLRVAHRKPHAGS